MHERDVVCGTPESEPLWILGRTTPARKDLLGREQRFLSFLQMLIESSQLRCVCDIIGHQMDHVHRAFAIE